MRVHSAELGSRVHRRRDLAAGAQDELGGLHDELTLALAGPRVERGRDLRRHAVRDRKREAVVGLGVIRIGIAIRVRRDDLNAKFVELGQRPLNLGQLPSAVRSPAAAVEEDVRPRVLNLRGQ